MKNVLLKYGYYDEYGFFSHVYYVDCDYSFNEKNVNEIEKLEVIDFKKIDTIIENRAKESKDWLLKALKEVGA